MKTEITQEIVRELLDYNPETGIMTWKGRDREWFESDGVWKRWNIQYAGKEAGCIATKDHYQTRVIRVFERNYKLHRLVWLWMAGQFPEGCIDHINRDATDNRWCNLRVVSIQENSFNRSKNINNTSGVTGVTWHKRNSKWEAKVHIKGKRYYLGHFAEDDFESAVKAVEDLRLEHGFSEDHGKEYAHYYKGDSE